jgi:23S rRNA pseudouridine1911/1915/1917 synthase
VSLNRGHVYRSQIGAEGRGLSPADFLARTYAHSTPETWQRRVDAGEVFVDGVRATTPEPLKSGQIVTWHRPPWDEPDVPMNWRLVYEDAALLAVDKPSGLPTMTGGGFSEHTLVALVTAAFPGATLMHRLGRGTSGLVLFARHHAAASKIQIDLRERRIRKIYRALGSGIAALDTYDIRTPIGDVAHPLLGTVQAASPAGKPSWSEATVLERRATTTLFDVEIHTGRPHQIRIHLASVGYPLDGDPLYLAGGAIRPETTALPGDEGYLLHARELRLSHPMTGAPLTLVAPPPPLLEATPPA